MKTLPFYKGTKMVKNFQTKLYVNSFSQAYFIFWGQIWIGDILAFSVVLGFLVGEMCILLENVYNLVNKMYI